MRCDPLGPSLPIPSFLGSTRRGQRLPFGLHPFDLHHAFQSGGGARPGPFSGRSSSLFFPSLGGFPSCSPRSSSPSISRCSRTFHGFFTARPVLSLLFRAAPVARNWERSPNAFAPARLLPGCALCEAESGRRHVAGDRHSRRAALRYFATARGASGFAAIEACFGLSFAPPYECRYFSIAKRACDFQSRELW